MLLPSFFFLRQSAYASLAPLSCQCAVREACILRFFFLWAGLPLRSRRFPKKTSLIRLPGPGCAVTDCTPSAPSAKNGAPIPSSLTLPRSVLQRERPNTPAQAPCHGVSIKDAENGATNLKRPTKPTNQSTKNQPTQAYPQAVPAASETFSQAAGARGRHEQHKRPATPRPQSKDESSPKSA